MTTQCINSYVVMVGQSHVAVYDTDPKQDKPALLAIHGNSSSKEFFSKQYTDSKLKEKYRIIAVDLPGHGQSEFSKFPQKDYSFSAYAKTICEVEKKSN